MASSSTSPAHKRFKYDVFLSFRGEDTRTNFVDHLYHQLQHKCIQTYKDDEKIRKGKNISDELIGSIEDSKFYIIVFSKNYASSSWCLDELVKIMECHRTNDHTAYPVFYDVEPSEVRKQSGAVAEAFEKYENEEAAGKWRDAMKEAADLAGWELKKTADGHEAKCIQKIVEELSLELRSIYFSNDEKLVGMETRINGVLSSLGTDFDDVRMIGIKGMGGGGKTTLARAVFDRISFDFDGKSFVENVREVSNASLSGLKSLQSQVLSDVLNDKGINMSSVYDGKHMMKMRMCDMKVLIVLDDVDHIDQLDALAGEPNWFKPGSIIIITTRDEQVLIAHQVTFIHNVNLLSNEEALCLFSRHAFGRKIPIQGYKELSKQVVCYAAGLPLTIRVLGSFLCGKNEVEWIDALERLKTIPLTETQKKLEISFIALEEDYKEMFLDVACILKGWRKDDAIRALESCGFHAKTGLRVLERKCLITIHRNRVRRHGHVEKVGMHDHIEEMGINIVRRSHPDKPYKHSRLWKIDEIEDILADDLGTEATMSIQLDTQKLNRKIDTKGLIKMKGLRFLSLGDHFRPLEHNIASPEFPNALRYLHLKYYPFTALPNTFQANKLVALEMGGSSIIQLWEGGERKVLKKLRFLDLSCSKLTTLDLGLAPNIEQLNLGGCCDLVELHMPVRCLNLIYVDLTHSRLKTLEVGLVPNLENLNLDNCQYLEELNMANKCQKLANLNISHSKIRTLNLGMTPNLKTLHLKECCNLVEILNPIGCLEKLVHLDLSGCFGLRTFLVDVKDYTSSSVDESLEVDPLAELHLNMESLESCLLHPGNILPKFQLTCFYKEDRPLLTGNLEMLISLGKCACTNLAKFSRSICGLRHIRKLKLTGNIVELLKDLDQLERLDELTMLSTTVDPLPDSIWMWKHLKSLELNRFVWLEKLPEDLGQLECLEKLDLSYTKIKHLPDSICMLKNLKSLKLRFCCFFEKLPNDLGRLECLEDLTLSSALITHLPNSIFMLKHLKSLELISCALLEKLPEDLGRLKCLEKLSLNKCEFLQHIPNSIGKMKSLKYFRLPYCIRVEKLPKELGNLTCLKVLNIEGTCISDIPESILLLKDVHIIGWRGLVQSYGFKPEIQPPECETSYVRLHGNGMIFRISERPRKRLYKELS